MTNAEQRALDEALAQPDEPESRELAPNHPRVTASFASFLADHGLELDGALALATHAVQAMPNDPQFLNTLGWVQAQRGDLDAAELTLLRALELAGQEPPVEEIRKNCNILQSRKAQPTKVDP